MEPSENADDPRHDILVRYRRFEITREQADAEAQALGFESLEFRPDPREFDPLTLPFWTLPMTLAWIIYRAREPVRELIEAYRAASLVWRHTGQFSINSGKPEKVFELLPPEPKSAFDVAYEARYRDVQEDLIYPGAAARNQLWEQLESGILVAEGIAPDQTAHNPIRDVEWKTLAFQPEAGIPVDAVSGWGENRPRFTQVILRSADVVALWPAPLGTDDAAKQMLARPAESLTAANALPGGIPERLLFSARRAELQRHAFVSQKPLEPPRSFSFDLCALLSEPRVWLRDAVGLMTFGAFCDIEDTKFRRAYERNRAAKPMFEAARRAELSLIGCLLERGDDTIAIPSHYFDLPRTLGNIDNSIEIVNNAIPDEDFYTRREDNYQSYRHVRTDTTTFKKWPGTLTSK